MQNFRDTRLQVHWALQAAAHVGRTLVPKQEDFSHESFEWLPRERVLAGAIVEGPKPFRSALRIADLTLVRLDPDNNVCSELPLEGRTLDDGFAFFESQRVTLEGIPDHPVASGACFVPDREQLEALEHCYAGAHASLVRLGLGPVRCWPHHFDIASLQTLSGSGEEARTIGAGRSPGDATYDEPYWYVTPWPYPDPAVLPPLSHGKWHTTGWVAAVLRLSEGGDVDAFLDEAVAACRRL